MPCAALCVLAVSACATTFESGKPFDFVKAQTFQKGKTTRSEIITALGEPASTGTSSEGRSITYMYSKTSANAFENIPAAYGLGSYKTTGQTAQCLFSFDAADVLKDFTCTGG